MLHHSSFLSSPRTLNCHRHSLGMASINTDHRYAQPLELAPQPRGCRAAFKPNRPEQTPRSPQDRNQLLLPAQLIPYHSQHRSKSALTIRPAPHNVPLSLSIVPRSHEVDLIPSWRADSPAFVWLDPGITPHKVANGDSNLIKVRFGSLCELSSGICRGPGSARRRASSDQHPLRHRARCPRRDYSPLLSTESAGSRHLWSPPIPGWFRPPRSQEFVDKRADFW